MPDIRTILADYHRDGFAVARGILPPEEADQMREQAYALVARGAAVERNDDVFDLEPGHSRENPRVRRIKRPHDVSGYFNAMARHPVILNVVTRLIGPNVRLNHSKINVKAAEYGSALEWHQDWAFIPHTNMDLVIVAIALDDCTEDNGPMLMLPGSHVGPLYSHHRGEAFVGAIDVRGEGVPVSEQAVPIVGPAGTVSFHHPMTVHGSAINKSDKSRSLLFYEYAASDAWPLFYGVDYQEFDSRIVAGEPCHEPRLENVHVRMPYPVATAGAIYEIQETLEDKYFADTPAD